MAVSPVSNAAELTAALDRAEGGDRIELTAGSYGAVHLKNRPFASSVTVASADPANSAVFTGLKVEGSAHAVFDGITLHYRAQPGDVEWIKPFGVYNSSFITLRNCTVFGDEVPSKSGSGDTFGNGYGLWVQGSDNVTVERCEIAKFHRGIAIADSPIFTLLANDMRGFRSDALDVINGDGVQIEGNWIHDFKKDPSTGDHPDMIQFWASPRGGLAGRDVVIRGNFLDAGTGGWTQTIFLWDGSYVNVLIEDNVIYNGHVHGITTSHSEGLTIRNNTLLDDPFVVSPLGPGWAPQIRVAASSVNVTIEDNIAEKGVPPGSGWQIGAHLKIGRDDYERMFFNAEIPGPTLDDLRAVTNGEIELGIYGAAMTRGLGLPLLVGPDGGVSPPPNVGPVAGFRFEATNLHVDFTDISTDSDGTIASWSWTFGDGGSISAASPSHTYATAGSYDVTLTVTDNDGATNSIAQIVTVAAATSGINPETQAALAALQVRIDALLAQVATNTTDIVAVGAAAAEIDARVKSVESRLTTVEGKFIGTATVWKA